MPFKATVRRAGPRVLDVGLITISAAVAFFEANDMTPPVDVPRSLVLVVGIAGSLAMWWRRRWPVHLTVIGIVVYLLTMNLIPVFVGLFSTAIQRRDRVLAGLTVAVAVGFAASASIDQAGLGFNEILNGILGVGIITAAGSYIGARRDLLASLRDRAERAESERELRAEQARLGERARIAREMHDVLAHKVSLIALHAGALEVNPHTDPARVEEVAALIRSTARMALEELREVLGVLRSEVGTDDVDLVPPPLAVDVQRLVDSSRAAGVQAVLSNAIDDLPAATARTVFRVVQEGLTNVHKHARGSSTVVDVSGDERVGVTVSIANKRAVAADVLLPGSGAGLVGLRERMRLVGGTLHSGPRPDGGWELVAWLPWFGLSTDPLSSDTPAHETSTT